MRLSILSCTVIAAVSAAALVPAHAQQVPLPKPAPLQKQRGAVAANTAAPTQASPAMPRPPSAPAAPTKLATAATPAAPRGAAQATTIQQVNAYFNSIKTLVGRFSQIDPDGTKKTGDFYLLKPGRVRFEYDAPTPIELVADGRSIAVRDRKLKTQDITPLSQTPLRFLLAEDANLARNGNVTAVYQDDVFVTVVMEEKQPMIGTYRLMIMFDAKTFQLKQWTVTDPQGYDTTVALYDLDATTRPDPMLFVINR